MIAVLPGDKAVHKVPEVAHKCWGRLQLGGSHSGQSSKRDQTDVKFPGKTVKLSEKLHFVSYMQFKPLNLNCLPTLNLKRPPTSQKESKKRFNPKKGRLAKDLKPPGLSSFLLLLYEKQWMMI